MTVVAPDPNWALRFAREAETVRSALGLAVSAIHHIGSTAIGSIYAKPIIDMLLVVRSLDAVDRRTPALVAEGYEAMGDFGLSGRRFARTTR